MRLIQEICGCDFDIFCKLHLQVGFCGRNWQKTTKRQKTPWGVRFKVN